MEIYLTLFFGGLTAGLSAAVTIRIIRESRMAMLKAMSD